MRKIDAHFELHDDRQTSGRLPLRSEISAGHQWRLEDIFPDDAAWERNFRKLEASLPKFAEFEGVLDESARRLLDCLRLRDKLETLFGRIFIYAGLKNDQDTTETIYQELRGRASTLMVRINEATAFIEPELMNIPQKKLFAFLDDSPALREHRHYFDDLLRSKTHILPPEQERLMAMAGELAQEPYNIFSMFNNADIKFPSIIDENGKQLEVTKARYSKLMESQDRRVRESAFHAMYESYSRWTNTLSATLAAAVKKDIFRSRARKYNNALEAALDRNNIPVSVYENTILTINENLEPLHRYMKLRKKLLKLDQLTPWDLSVPIIKDDQPEIPYEQARQIICAALKPLGAGYCRIVQQSFQNGWVDVYENVGKRSGAYSWSTYGPHPYILMNYQDSLNNMFTLAHEMGHALHSYYTHKKQPYHYSQYTIFVAEVASTFNEALVMDYLVKQTSDRQRKLYLLNEYIDQIRGTVYIQTLFAEFEKNVHEYLESGHALTADYFSELCRELYQRYFGPAFSINDLFAINWCRVPHFYYNFYVYQYATGFSAATALSQQVLGGDRDARDRYLHFLSRGSSAYSIDLLRDAGVDMASPAPIEATARLMDRLLDEMETLLEDED